MNAKIDPLSETVIVNVSPCDMHAAQTVVQSVDFHAATRDLSVTDVSEPDTGLATTFWLAHAAPLQTEVVAQQTEVAAAIMSALPSSSRPRRPFLVAAALLVVALLVLLGVTRARSGYASAPTIVAQAVAVTPPALQQPATSTVQATAPTTPRLSPEQLRALETEAVRALFAADVVTAMAHYRALSAGGHDVAQRVVTLLERAP